jgi:hypothetical protein
LDCRNSQNTSLRIVIVWAEIGNKKQIAALLAVIGLLRSVLIHIGRTMCLQMYAQSAAAQMYAAQGYPGYLGYPAAAAAYSPMQAYYPSLAAAYSYPGMQPAQLRPTIMVPVSVEYLPAFSHLMHLIVLQ